MSSLRSEYLGDKIPLVYRPNGIENEDPENLQFSDSTFNKLCH